ncbi:MAG: glutamate formimidoyltransferase [Bacteroidia bacterium]
MLSPTVVSVPNFSEGQNETLIHQIVEAASKVPHVKVIVVDKGHTVNRSVMTLGGPPQAVYEALMNASQVAIQKIHMAHHQGVHPRIGAVDVVPFIPYHNFSEEEAITLAKNFAKEFAERFKVPVYLYAKASQSADRRLLTQIRAGGYEGLQKKLQDPRWKPDFGPTEFNAQSGATVVGVRDWLAAFNINLNTKSPQLAQQVADQIRQSSQADSPYKLPHVQAIGWFIPEYNCAQVSLNIPDLEAVPLHKVLATVEEAARSKGLRVIGTELIGALPKRFFLEPGRYFLAQQQLSAEGMPEADILDVAVHSLMLNALRPFIVKERILEYTLGDPHQGLLEDLPLSELIWRFYDKGQALSSTFLVSLLGSAGAAIAARLSTGLPNRGALLQQDFWNLGQELLRQPLDGYNGSPTQTLQAARKIVKLYARFRELVPLLSKESYPEAGVLIESFLAAIQIAVVYLRHHGEKKPEMDEELKSLELQAKFFTEEIIKKLNA